MKYARLSWFLTLALALISLETISWVVPPLTVARAQSAGLSAQTCTIRTWHREVHHEAGFTLTLALIGGFTRTGVWCKTVGAGSPGGEVMKSRRYQEATQLFHDSYGWYWAKATFIPAGEGRRQSASTIHSCQATTGRCAPVS